MPAPTRTSSGEPQAGQSSCPGCAYPQWWQRRTPSPWSTSATSQLGQRRVSPHARQWRAGTRPRRLRSRIALPPSRSMRGRARRAAARTADSRPRGACPRRDTGGSGAPSRPPSSSRSSARPALGARRRRAVDRDRTLERGALRGDGAGVVARVGLLLVRRVVLLVDADEPEPRQRREHRRAGADDHRRRRRTRSVRARRAAPPRTGRSEARRRGRRTGRGSGRASAASARSPGRARSRRGRAASAAAHAWR